MGMPFTKDVTHDSAWAEAQAGAKAAMSTQDKAGDDMFSSEHKDLPGPVDAGQPE
jgi:hypothetical protein